MKILSVIYEFSNKDGELTNGFYHVELDSGNKYYFLRNGESVGAIQHYYGKEATECISTIRDDIKKQFFELRECQEKGLK